jgi:hypothetical protein
MLVRAQFLTQTSADCSWSSPLIWRTDASPEETVAQLKDAIGARDGSWIDGSRFQLAPSCDPWAPVLNGRIHASAEGSEIWAKLDLRQEVRDLLRFGRWLLFLITALFTVGALWQLRGMDLWLSLVGLGLGAAVAVGTQSALQSCMLESAQKTVDPKHLCQLLTRMLRS